MSDAPHKDLVDSGLPEDLQDDLQALFGAAEIPLHSAEKTIRTRIGFQLVGLRRARLFRTRVRVGLVAAGLLAAVGLALQAREKVRPLAPRDASLAVENSLARGPRDDIDGNGRVDVLDAFALARELKRGIAHPGTNSASALDLNGDGVADQRDVDLLVGRAVDLEAGPDDRWKGR